jgi:F0F1-type ATP synthase assembly protein I
LASSWIWRISWGLDERRRVRAGAVEKQRKVTKPPDDRAPLDDRAPIAIAMQWAATVMTISAEMVVPGLVGYWIDQRLGTRAVFLLIGFALGAVLAASALMRIAKNRSNTSGGQGNVGQSKHDRLE